MPPVLKVAQPAVKDQSVSISLLSNRLPGVAVKANAIVTEA
jgi:hypothetical protein